MSAQALRAEERAAPYLVAPVLIDHLDTFASAPEGFTRLRELVLNLAVRGRLVPQDAKDESAEYLINKRSKRTDGELQSPCRSLPVGWAFASLSELGSFSGGKTPSTNNSAYWDGTIPWVTPKDMKLRDIFDTQDHVSDLALSDGLNQIEAGSVLIVVRSGILRRMLPVAIARTRCTVNQDLKALQLARPQMATFVRLLLLGHERWILETLTKTGTTVESVKFDELAECLFPLPPLSEQFRIVAKVEELMALIDRLEAKVSHGETARGKLLDALLAALADSPNAAATADAWAQLAPHFDLLFQTPADVDRLQQTLLTLAVKGRLVPQDPNDEPAAELLKRIRAEKERLVAKGKIRRDKPISAFSADEQSFALPSGWRWVQFGEVSICRDGERIPVSSEEREKRNKVYAYYGASGVIDKIDGYLFDGTLLLIGEDGANLINRSTPIAFLAQGKFWVNNHAHVIDGLDVGLLDYLCLFINAISLEPYVTGTAQPKMNQAKLNSIPIALPPAAEQRRIVAALASFIALCDRLRERLAARRELSAKLAAKLAATLTESALA